MSTFHQYVHINLKFPPFAIPEFGMLIIQNPRTCLYNLYYVPAVFASTSVQY